jgi:hypothetical protein
VDTGEAEAGEEISSRKDQPLKAGVSNLPSSKKEQIRPSEGEGMREERGVDEEAVAMEMGEVEDWQRFPRESWLGQSRRGLYYIVTL